jgi:hypothetical protein
MIGTSLIRRFAAKAPSAGGWMSISIALRHGLREVACDLGSGQGVEPNTGVIVPIPQSRSRLMTRIACANALGLEGPVVSNFGTAARSADVDPPPEIMTVRIEKDPVICNGPKS